MKYLLLGFVIALICSLNFMPGADQRTKYKMPVGVADVKSTAMGGARTDIGIPEIEISDDRRLWRLGEKITDSPGGKPADFPMGGQN